MSELKKELEKLAESFSNPDNQLLILAEESGEKELSVIAETLAGIEILIKQANDKLNNTNQEITETSLELLASLANILDASEDESLCKQAKVIDNFLLTIAENKKWNNETKLDYEDSKKRLDELNKVDDAKKAIEKSKVTEQYRPLQQALSSRHCPEHAGVMLERIGDETWRCQLDGRTYSWREGFTTLDGNKVPGGSVEEQTKMDLSNAHSMFDTRDERMANRS